MASKGSGVSFPRKSYRLTSEVEKSRATGKGWWGCGEAFWVVGMYQDGRVPCPMSLWLGAAKPALFTRNLAGWSKPNFSPVMGGLSKATPIFSPFP